MPTRALFLALIVSLLATPVPAVDIATGKMLGPGYEARSFYIREPGEPWRKTYSGPNFRPQAASRLMNLRVAQALFHDEWMTEVEFDPEKHTQRVIDALDAYQEHGILAINVSLQGGNPAYERFPAISRDRPFKLGPGKGALIVAFRPDGSLKDSWLKRLLSVVKALDRRGMVLDLMYFYQHQDELFENPAAIDRATVNITDWLIDNDCRNVIIEIANEHDVRSYDHDRYIHGKMGHLIELARSRFAAKNAPFRLPVSASIGGRMAVYDGVIEHADLVIIHGNNRTPAEKQARVAERVADPRMPGPIHMNEDNNGRETTPENLALELASFDVVYEAGGGWGYMPWVQLQIFPFRHVLPAPTTRVTAEMPVGERDPAYFYHVLEHIRRTVMTEEAAAAKCELSKR